MEGKSLHLFAQIKAKLKPVFLIVYEFVTGVMVSFEPKGFRNFLTSAVWYHNGDACGYNAGVLIRTSKLAFHFEILFL